MAGSNPALIVRVAATIEELRKNLAEGKSQIETTTAAMQKMAASFSGDKLIQAAQNTVAAVHQIGGATKLTGAEQERVNVLLEKALEKYRVLGREAPAGMQQLADATKNATSAGSGFSSFLGSANGLLGAFGVGLSVGAVVGFGKELLRMGDEIVRVADRTGLTTKEVQQFTYIAGQSGNTIDELTGAIGAMQNRLSSGDKSAVGAVKELGINFQQLIASSPADQMEMIATAIAKVPDPADRTRLAMDLFGKTGTAILPTLTSQFAALRAEAPVMSDATVKALDTAGDQLAKFGLQIKVWAADAYLYAGKGFDGIIKWAYEGIASLLEMTASLASLVEKIPGAGKVFALAGVDVQALTTDAQWFRDAAAGIGREVDVTTPKIATLGGAMKATAEDTEKAAKAAVAAGAEAAKWALVMEELTAVGVGFSGTLAKIDGEVVEAVKYYLQAGVAQGTLATAYGLTAVQIKAVASAMSEELAMAKVVADFTKSAAATQDALNAKAMAGIEAKTAAIRKAAADEVLANQAFLDTELAVALAQDKVNAGLGAVAPAASTAAAAIAALTTGFESFKGVLVGVADSAHDVTSAVLSIDPSVGMNFGNNIGMAMGLPAGQFGGNLVTAAGKREAALPRFGTGGPVRSDGPIYAHAGEYVVPKGGGGPGGGTTIVQYISITQPLGTPETIARALGDAAMASLKNSGTRFPVGS